MLLFGHHWYSRFTATVTDGRSRACSCRTATLASWCSSSSVSCSTLVGYVTDRPSDSDHPRRNCQHSCSVITVTASTVISIAAWYQHVLLRYINFAVFMQEGLQRRLHSAPRMKRETRILPIWGRCLWVKLLRERRRPLPKCWYRSIGSWSRYTSLPLQVFRRSNFVADF